ncbi:MAG: cytochrome C oxidase subunit I [Gallionellales bacterium RIFCSPLOWO2_12_FULL_59_22]|nr:MAG: cytochrome C oxidase subunit I [Gallionellales bacterium RIFCSPLOWO2_02_FULL_59_110]OGT04504.1 MAG: cytochrome C oxidase subunit I [Gallionellales bacterium RIFCSPLOWO2_02_58_13]OGT13510.1 MAG: cytochrome C oxidase subunit I [Gallionellales bacterium RIFCSPLOWO2_12_FULL_59_22]
MATTTMSDFRIDPVSGLKIHRTANTLVKWNAFAAVVFLLVGGLFGLGVALTRMPSVQLLSPELFYMALTAHGLVNLAVWIIFFEMAVLYFLGAHVLGSRIAAPKWAWAQFWLMLVGAALVAVAVLGGNSSVMMTSYPPLQAEPHFYLGLILFAVGALIGCFVFLGTLVVAKREKTYQGSLPLVVFGGVTATVIAVFTIVSGALILIPTFFWSIGLISHIDPMMYRVVWWGFGHSSQQINVVAHISIWYLIASLVFGAKPMSEKVSRGAFLLYILFLQLGSAHHLLSDPGLTSAWKILNTSYMIYLAVLASMIHGLTVPGSIEVAQRRKGLDTGLFTWLRKAPWGNPIFSGMFLSLVGFGFIGGVSGVVMSVEQINMVIHNTAYLPGHFHGTLVAGTTMAFMAVTYWLIPVVFQRKIALAGVAKLQPYIFSLGAWVFSIALMGAGTLGVQRRHADITFAGQPLAYEYPEIAKGLMDLGEIFGVVMSVGAVMFIVVVLASIFAGERIEEGSAPWPKVEDADVTAERTGKKHIGAWGMEAPGTFVLAIILFVTLVLYYFVNFKYLSTVWGMS